MPSTGLGHKDITISYLGRVYATVIADSASGTVMLAEAPGLFHFLNAYTILDTDLGANFSTQANETEFRLI